MKNNLKDCDPLLAVKSTLLACLLENANHHSTLSSFFNPTSSTFIDTIFLEQIYFLLQNGWSFKKLHKHLKSAINSSNTKELHTAIKKISLSYCYQLSEQVFYESIASSTSNFYFKAREIEKYPRVPVDKSLPELLSEAEKINPDSKEFTKNKCAEKSKIIFSEVIDKIKIFYRTKNINNKPIHDMSAYDIKSWAKTIKKRLFITIT